MSIAEDQAETNLVFYVNGQRIEDAKVDPRTTLADYVRDKRKRRVAAKYCKRIVI